MTSETKARLENAATARGFIDSLKTKNPFNELETKNIILLMENYAKIKCSEQRAICADKTIGVAEYHNVLFAPEPKLDLPLK